jgi:nucleotide-binding universal stress UspA family protein
MPTTGVFGERGPYTEPKEETMKLLVAFDGLDPSVVALDAAAEIASAERAEVTVISVVAPDARGTKSGGHVGAAPHAGADVAYASRYLGERGLEVGSKVAHGDPADEILEEALAGGYDLIVVGTRELGPIVGRIMGSVSRKVVQHAPCAVVVAGKSGTVRLEPTTSTRATAEHDLV